MILSHSVGYFLVACMYIYPLIAVSISLLISWLVLGFQLPSSQRLCFTGTENGEA